MTAADSLGDSLQRRRPYAGLQEALVHTVDGDGQLFVRLVGTGQRFVHGPVVWTAPDPLPSAGTSCLVGQSDVGRWWLISL